jgi:RNA polymerase sigma-70 factor (ECF subfamily)
MESHALDDVPERTVNSAEESFLEKADVKAILAAIDEHPEPGKEVLRLRLLGGLSFRQIGDAMGKTETWARVTYYRAKQNIVKELDQDE